MILVDRDLLSYWLRIQSHKFHAILKGTEEGEQDTETTAFFSVLSVLNIAFFAAPRK